MALDGILTPLGILIEIVVAGLGLFLGAVRKKRYGYPIAISFLLFAGFDVGSLMGLSADLLAALNILAIISALIAVWLLVKTEIGTR
ncbi:MAG: hypothetical protein LUQ25_05930 [Methanoregulaceae archaeon]|nr:hypothetical protein [Methanoregulaceae archaeon]